MSARIYIAGPMTGLPEHNYPAFHEAERRLKALGFEVCNPATNPGPDLAGWTRQGLEQMFTCDTVALLDGWERSRGTLLEVQTAGLQGLRVVTMRELCPTDEMVEDAARAIRRCTDLDWPSCVGIARDALEDALGVES